MSFIENAKTYTGRDLETIFFRPMLSGQSALDLGVRILYNMPAPTTVQLWERSGDILQQYTAAGWTGGDPARKLQKTIDMSKVKAELGYSAADYFSMIYELITNRADVNMDDLTGTELEQAETELFKRAIAESLRVTMWIGDKEAGAGTEYATFNGFIKRIYELLVENKITAAKSISTRSPTPRRPTSAGPKAGRYSPTTAFRSSTSTCRPTCAIRPTPNRSAC